MRIGLSGTPAAPLREALESLAGREPIALDDVPRCDEEALDLVVVPVGALPTGTAPGDVVVYGSDADAAIRDLDAGAVLWIDDHEEPARLRARLSTLVRDAMLDGRTGLAAPARFLAVLDGEFRRAARYRRPLGFLSLALPSATDAARGAASDPLARAATIAAETIREVDRAGRLRGPRLAVLMPESDAAAARVLATRLSDALPEGDDARFGLAAFPARDIASGRHLAGRALEALARAAADRPGAVVTFGDPDVVWARSPPEPDSF